jgi:hypothetical protein
MCSTRTLKRSLVERTPRRHVRLGQGSLSCRQRPENGYLGFGDGESMDTEHLSMTPRVVLGTPTPWRSPEDLPSMRAPRSRTDRCVAGDSGQTSSLGAATSTRTFKPSPCRDSQTLRASRSAALNLARRHRARCVAGATTRTGNLAPSTGLRVSGQPRCQFRGAAGAASVAAGSGHVCARSTAGVVRCRGDDPARPARRRPSLVAKLQRPLRSRRADAGPYQDLWRPRATKPQLVL